MPSAPRVHQRQTASRKHGIAPQTNRQATRALHTNSKAWLAIRKQRLVRDRYTCQTCGKYGNQVDHIDGDSHNNAEDNLQTLCRACHSLKTAIETGRVSMLPRFKYKPVIPVTVIAGPPGSGKTTYARERSGPHDMILDLDEIKAEIAGCDVHDTPDDVLPQAIAERNNRLARLSRRGPYEHCWFVVMAPRRTERQHWQEYLNAEVVVLDVSADECLRRITADPTRQSKPREYWERIVDEWWKRYIPD